MHLPLSHILWQRFHCVTFSKHRWKFLGNYSVIPLVLRQWQMTSMNEYSCCHICQKGGRHSNTRLFLRTDERQHHVDVHKGQWQYLCWYHFHFVTCFGNECYRFQTRMKKIIKQQKWPVDHHCFLDLLWTHPYLEFNCSK